MCVVLQAQLLMSNFDEAKLCLKKVVKLLQDHSQLTDTETDQKRLNTGRHIMHFTYS